MVANLLEQERVIQEIGISAPRKLFLYDLYIAHIG
jgi:hypothetical protein